MRRATLACMAAEDRFSRACRREAVDATPIWLMRQAGRYMPEYRAVRARHSILEICKTPALAAEVTITAAEALGVDAAIIFADLLLPVEPLGFQLRFAAGEGPLLSPPLRTPEQIRALPRTLGGELGYIAEAIRHVHRHFNGSLPVIGFAGAPFTLASYLIEGGSSRNYLFTKGLMYAQPAAWQELMELLVAVLDEYIGEQIAAGAAAIQIFDSWAGALGDADYRRHALPFNRKLVAAIQARGVPAIYFSTGTSGYLETVEEVGAQVISVDWRIELETAWRRMGFRPAIQGNLDPALLFAPREELRGAADALLAQGTRRPGYIFNLGHGILPGTPVDQVRALVDWVHEYQANKAS